jgi:hypothetical protein
MVPFFLLARRSGGRLAEATNEYDSNVINEQVRDRDQASHQCPTRGNRSLKCPGIAQERTDVTQSCAKRRHLGCATCATDSPIDGLFTASGVGGTPRAVRLSGGTLQTPAA